MKYKTMLSNAIKSVVNLIAFWSFQYHKALDELQKPIDDNTEPLLFEWATVELLGHRRIEGEVCQIGQGSATLYRVVSSEGTTIVSPRSVYAITGRRRPEESAPAPAAPPFQDFRAETPEEKCVAKIREAIEAPGDIDDVYLATKKAIEELDNEKEDPEDDAPLSDEQGQPDIQSRTPWPIILDDWDKDLQAKIKAHFVKRPISINDAWNVFRGVPIGELQRCPSYADVARALKAIEEEGKPF